MLAYCDTLIDFLEKNQIYNNPYSVKAATFEPFYSILSRYYKTSTDFDQFLKLVRAEQTIHLITYTVNTQDISPYLAILEDMCNAGHLNELILLLSKKHCASSKGFTSNYRKWIKFLTPYFKFLVKMEFDYFRILQLSEKDILLKDCLSELKESLSKKGVMVDSEITEQQVQQIKKQFLETEIEKDEDYYSAFGLITFILHFTSYPGKPEFFKICIALESYIGASSSVHLNGLIESEYLNALRASARNIFAQSAKKLLVSVCNSSPLNLEFLGLALETFLKTNVFYEENDTLEKILHAVKSEKSLLLTLKSTYYGEYITLYESLVRLALLVIYKGVHFTFPTPEQKEKFLEFAKTLFEKDLFDIQGLRPYVKEKYYNVIQLLTSPIKFIDTWNLSKIPLETIINRQDIQEDLLLNLKFSFKFMEEKSSTKDFQLTDQTQTLSDLLRTFISTAETHKIHSSSPITAQLKTISTFLLKIFNLNIVFPKDLKIRFLHSFTDFVANKCSPNEWDVLDFQTDYWKTLQSTSSTKTVVLEKAFQRFFEIVEENLAKASIEANCEYQDRSYIKEAEISVRLDNLALASLERIESSLTTQWYLITWKNALDHQVHQKILKLKLECKTFIYSTQKWLVYLLDNNKFQHTEAFDPKFTNILLKLSHLYFHPAFLLLTEALEQKKFLEAYSKIVDQNKFIRWNARIVFFGTLGHRVTFLNRMFHSDIKPQAAKEQVLQLDLSQIRENHQSFNKETILYIALLKRISQLPDILRGFDGCSMDEAAQNQYIDMLKKLSPPLIDFVLNVFSVETKAPLESDPLFRAILKGLESLLKPPHSVFSAFNAIQGFFCQLLQEGFRNNLPTGVSSKMLRMILVLNEMLKGRLKEVLLCTTICQGTPINQIIRATLGYIDYKIGKTSETEAHPSENDMKLIHKFALQLIDYFNQNFKTICNTLEAYNFGISSQNFEKHLFNSLVKTLNSLQAEEIILYQNSQTDEIFVSVLRILEKCFITLKKDVIKAIEPIQSEISTLESNLADDYQEFEALFGDDEPVIPTVISNVQEVNQKIKDEIALKKKELEKTRGEADEIDQQFFQSLQYFILVYPFAEAKKTWSSILTPIQEKSLNELTQLLNNLIQNISTSTQDGFLKILNFTPDNSLNLLLTIQGCLNRLLAFLQRPEGDYSIQESFVWNLITGTSSLFSDFHLKTQNFDRFVETVQDLIANTCKLVLTYLTCKYLNNSAQMSLAPDQIKSFSHWIQNTLNLYCFLSEHPQSKISIYNDPTILNILGMLQIFSDSLDFVDLISTILNTKTKKSWTVTLTYFIASVLEKPLQDGLPEDQLILTQIKKLLSGSAYFTLPITNLASDPLIIEKEKTSQEELLTILENKFKINSLQTPTQNPDPSKRLASQNLNISFGNFFVNNFFLISN